MSTRISEAGLKNSLAPSLSKRRTYRLAKGRTVLRRGGGERSLVLLLLLAACGQQSSDNATAPIAENSNQPAATASPEPAKIPCAAPGAELAPVCAVDRAETPNGVILTLRHPDGAFHRLQITRDGRGVIAADGAEPAKVKPLGPDIIEVELAGARYRLPATVRGQ